MSGPIDKSRFGDSGVAGAFMASATQNKQEEFLKKPEENPLSNANLPGGLFTHPSVC